MKKLTIALTLVTALSACVPQKTLDCLNKAEEGQSSRIVKRVHGVIKLPDTKEVRQKKDACWETSK